MEKNVDGQSVVRVLDFPENFRSKWSMYIDNESGCLREIIDNATDESYSCNYCNDIFINTDFEGWNIVMDSGRGIPIFMSPDRENQTQADVSISVAHAGSKFKGTGITKTGTFGLGSSIVNALSEDYILMSVITPDNFDKSIKPVFDLWNSCGPRSKKNLYYIVWYKKGYKHYEGAHKLDEIENQIFGRSKVLPQGYSTMVMFKPDPEIFGKPKTEVPIENLRNFVLIQEKFYKRKINLHINGETVNNFGFTPFKYEILKTITPSDTSMNKSVGVYVTFEIDPNLSPKDCYGSVNGLKVDTGVHIQYIESSYEQALKSEYKLKHRFIFPGLKMFVLVLADEISYDSQTKVRLKSITNVKSKDFGDIVKEFQKIFRKDPAYWEEHVTKLNYLADSMKSLSAVEKAQKIIDTSGSGNSWYRSKNELVPGFSDATSGPSDRWNCELFLCFTGDTEILTCNNERINFVDLTERINSGEDIYTFSCTPERIIKPAKIIASKKIKKSNKITTVFLDNGEKFRCTPDHKIMMKSGNYVEAQNLKEGDSLMPYRVDNKLVVSVITEDIEEDVYCLEVDTPEHNFPLACGVFVKNCEGLSPAGSLKSGRKTTKYHAVLPLRGKVKNVSEVDANTMMENKEFFTIFKLIGLGIDDNNVTKGCKTYEEAMNKIAKHSRYGKIIIATDED